MISKSAKEAMKRIQIRNDAMKLAQSLPAVREGNNLVIRYLVEDKQFVAMGVNEQAVRGSFESQYVSYFFNGRRKHENKRRDRGNGTEDKNIKSDSL